MGSREYATMSVNRTCAISRVRLELQSEGGFVADDTGIELLVSLPAGDSADGTASKPDSVSRFSRCRSARISDACW